MTRNQKALAVTLLREYADVCTRDNMPITATTARKLSQAIRKELEG